MICRGQTTPATSNQLKVRIIQWISQQHDQRVGPGIANEVHAVSETQGEADRKPHDARNAHGYKALHHHGQHAGVLSDRQNAKSYTPQGVILSYPAIHGTTNDAWYAIPWFISHMLHVWKNMLTFTIHIPRFCRHIDHTAGAVPGALTKPP